MDSLQAAHAASLEISYIKAGAMHHLLLTCKHSLNEAKLSPSSPNFL